jgi:multicomponent Na+:H+ antiporter subunit E
MLLAAFWAILSDGRGWTFGIPVVLLAATLSCLLLPRTRVSVSGLLTFVPYFAWNSLRGGLDVASRALHPDMPIAPALLRYELQLDNRVGRALMANVVTLLPGTLSVDLRGDVLLVHVLNADGPFPEAFRRLEARVTEIFGAEDSSRSR